MKLKSHHFCSFITFAVGVSFLFEKYMILSPALIGPVTLLSWVPGPLLPIQLWGVLFLLGAALIFVSFSPTFRVIFLIFGAVSWTFFASASIYASLIGPAANSTGSLLGIMLFALVFRFFVAIKDVSTDFTSKKKDATIDA